MRTTACTMQLRFPFSVKCRKAYPVSLLDYAHKRAMLDCDLTSSQSRNTATLFWGLRS